ncbi:SH3 domain protein, partial [Ostertagia ostertagi]
PSMERPSTGYQRRVDRLRTSTRKTHRPAPPVHAVQQMSVSHGMTSQNTDVRPAPRPNKPKPPTKPRMYPVVRAMYDYDAQDTDELSFSANDEIELMQKTGLRGQMSPDGGKGKLAPKSDCFQPIMYRSDLCTV